MGFDKCAYSRAYARDTYHWRKEHGICTRCGKEDAEPHKALCAECAEKQSAQNKRYWGSLDEKKRQKFMQRTRERNRARREQRKSMGLCVICGKKAAKGKAHCIECLLKIRRRHHEQYEAERVKTDFGEGLCCRCNEPVVPGKKLCAKHYDIALRATKKANRLNQKKKTNAKHVWQGNNKICFGQKK